ncbi:MAG: 3'-5' exonuclease [Bacteroidota bacterium]
MNYIIYDLEATCWESNHLDMERETIEIGAVLLNQWGEDIGSYNRFVKPVLHPYLSPFCQDLTSITQQDINVAKTFPHVIEEFKEWAGVYDEEYVLCSWGNFDKVLFERDCALHQLDADWCAFHINLKKQYQNFRKLKKPIGLKKAVAKEGFEFDGIHHRGISDAENLTKIFLKHIDVWEMDF